MRTVRFCPEPPLPVDLVVLIVPLEPHYLAVAFERQHVGRDAIEEPSVVADHDGTTGEVEERFLQRTERIDVEIIRRLVEQQQVRPLLQQLGEMDAIALAA